MAGARPQARLAFRPRASWPHTRGEQNCALAIVACALTMRLIAALAVDIYASGRHQLCLFDDTRVYWELASQLMHGEPYQIDQFGIPHHALRVPGYPLFLAFVRVIGFDATLPVRIVQAFLGAWSVLILMRMVDRITGGDERSGSSGWRSPTVLAGLIAAFEPWSVGMSALLLSEALFVPLMILALYGMACLAHPTRLDRPGLRVVACLVCGFAHGAAVMARPSWVLFPIVALPWFVMTRPRGGKARAFQQALLIFLSMVLIQCPWWVRNAGIYGRFVPTALWFGASLYDGMNPAATGASDMRFLEEPRYRVLDETVQDRVLRDDAIDFARRNPLRVVWLAVVKAGRFWSPWPNADELASPLAMVGSTLVTLPLYYLITVGAVSRRRDLMALLVLLGPLIYFALIHMVFVGSLRYRIAAIVPAFGLAGIGLGTMIARRLPRGEVG